MVLERFPTDQQHIAARRFNAPLHLVIDISFGLTNDGLSPLGDGLFKLNRPGGIDANICVLQNHDRLLVNGFDHSRDGLSRSKARVKPETQDPANMSA